MIKTKEQQTHTHTHEGGEWDRGREKDTQVEYCCALKYAAKVCGDNRSAHTHTHLDATLTHTTAHVWELRASRTLIGPAKLDTHAHNTLQECVCIHIRSHTHTHTPHTHTHTWERERESQTQEWVREE